MNSEEELGLSFKPSTNSYELILPLFQLQCWGPGSIFFPGRLLSLPSQRKALEHLHRSGVKELVFLKLLLLFVIVEFQVSFFFNINLFIYLFIYLFLAALGFCCCARAFSLVVVSEGYSSLWCMGLSWQWPLPLRSTGSRSKGFSSCSTWAH